MVVGAGGTEYFRCFPTLSLQSRTANTHWAWREKLQPDTQILFWIDPKDQLIQTYCSIRLNGLVQCNGIVSSSATQYPSKQVTIQSYVI